MSVLFLLTCMLLHCAFSLKNPIISGWNPDPSILRVGSEYFLATSSFEYFPGTPIYRSTDLVNWDLFSHAQTNSSQVQLYGTPTGAGVWAPTLSYINGKFYLASMSRWTYDPVARVWPRVMWMVSSDMKTWSDPIWAEPWGIDPSLFQDPNTGRVYLNLMAPNNNIDRLWGIAQCEVDLISGSCIGPYRALWNGTLPHNSTSRPEGPKMFAKDAWYYLLIAEGGTDDLHRSSIARSSSPSGPFTPAPNNPLIYNGAWGADNLTVQSTGHATMFSTAQDEWFAVFLARRKVNGTSPLGRETFMCTVDWTSDGWPVFNGGKPILLSENVGDLPHAKCINSFHDSFNSSSLDSSWYQLRNPYTKNYDLERSGGIIFRPNVFGLSDRDVPAALLRKQKSLNMTFSARLSDFHDVLSPRQSVGISAYLSEFQHQDIYISGCVNTTANCLYTSLLQNTTTTVTYIPLNGTSPGEISLHIRAEPLAYHLGYSVGNAKPPIWLSSVSSSWLAFAPSGWFVFSGASFSMFASGGGQPWGANGPKVGFSNMSEIYYDVDIPDYDRW